MSRYTPTPLVDLRAELATILLAKQSGKLAAPIGELLGHALEKYLARDPYTMSTLRENGLSRMPEREQVIARAALEQTTDLLRAADPSRAGVRQMDRLIQDTTLRTGERVFAMWMAGEAEGVIHSVSAMATEVVEDFSLRGVIHRCGQANGLSVSQLAPAVFAALIAHENEDQGLSATEALKKFGLGQGSKVPSKVLRSLGEVLHAALLKEHEKISRRISVYSQTAQSVFNPGPGRGVEEEGPAYRLVAPAEDAQRSPLIRMGTLIAFAASARGGGDEARIEGALEIYRSLLTVAQKRATTPEAAPTRYALLDKMTSYLRNLSQVVRAEQSAHREVEARWKEIEKELEKEAKFLQRGWNPEDGPMPIPQYPFPEEFSALECRALYIQNAVARGIPLGLVLQELYDSDKMTFGPTERQFFERIAFYAARKFSSDLAAQSDLRVEGAATRRVRVEEVRGVARAIELELREKEYLPDDELIKMGNDMLRAALSGGELNREEGYILLGRSAPLVQPRGGEPAPSGSIAAHMVSRIRARQEVRLLTALVATEGGIPRDVVKSYGDLPHTRYHAMQSLPEFNLRHMIARNGQEMSDLETSTRARWLRYRLQEASHQDVITIALEQGDAREVTSTFRSNVKKKPFQGQGQRKGAPESSVPDRPAIQPMLRRSR